MLTEKQLESRRRRNARGLDEVLLDCRLIGHQWKRVQDTNENPPLFGLRVCYSCERCGSGRCDIVQRTTGGLLGRSYEYVTGYQLEAITDGGDRERPVNNDALRFELVRRLDEHVTVPGVPAIGETP
jgi:hypothetical protein